MLRELEWRGWTDLVVTANTRVKRKGSDHVGVVMSPRVENDALLVWWGTADNRAFVDWVPVSELEEINVEEISCALEPSELPSGDLEANAPEGKGDVSNE